MVMVLGCVWGWGACGFGVGCGVGVGLGFAVDFCSNWQDLATGLPWR